MGIGNLSNAIRAYAGAGTDVAVPDLVRQHDLSYARLYFHTSPLSGAAAWRTLTELQDDSSNYYWKVLACREILRLARTQPDRLAELAALHGRGGSAARVLHPEGDTASGPARPETTTALAWIQRVVGKIVPGEEPLQVVRSAGWTIDVSREYASDEQATAFQYVLDRLTALDLDHLGADARAHPHHGVARGRGARAAGRGVADGGDDADGRDDDGRDGDDAGVNAARSAAGSSSPSASASRTRALSGASPGSRSTPRSAQPRAPAGLVARRRRLAAGARRGDDRDAALDGARQRLAQGRRHRAGGVGLDHDPAQARADRGGHQGAVGAQVGGDVRDARLDARGRPGARAAAGGGSARRDRPARRGRAGRAAATRRPRPTPRTRERRRARRGRCRRSRRRRWRPASRGGARGSATRPGCAARRRRDGRRRASRP